MEQLNAANRSVDNLSLLGLTADHGKIRILWMYPDSLNLHGGRGDLMALLRFATMCKLPVEIRRVENLSDPVPLDQADMLYFCCSDLDCVPDVVRALEPIKTDLERFAAEGKVIMCNGSTGAVLGRDLWLLNGTLLPCLGLLGMHWTQRQTIHGNDLWLRTDNGIEIIGNEIKRADVTLEPGQKPFAAVKYGGGNHGDGFEGAITGNVIYTACLGPVLVRNPWLAVDLLRRAAAAAGLETRPEQFILPSDAIVHEQKGFEEAKRFIEKKMHK